MIFDKAKFTKFMYFWFSPFLVGICLSMGYNITNKLFFISNKAVDDLFEQYTPNTKNDSMNSGDAIYEGKEKLIIKSNEERWISLNLPIIL